MSGLGAAATTVLLAAAAIAVGALAASRRPAAGPARSRRALHLEWWPALVAGTALLLLVELVDVPGGVVLLLGAYALLAAVCLKNLVWTGTPLVALGLALMALPTIVDGGLPVSRDALATMGYHEPPAALPGERHVEVPRDQLRALGDIVPMPIGWRPVSFGELIVLVGLADVAYNATARRRGRRRSRDRDDGGIDTIAGLVVAVDPLEDEPTVVVLGRPGPELEAELRARARQEERERRRSRGTADTAPAPSRPVIFDVEADTQILAPADEDADTGKQSSSSSSRAS
jgi:Family of unknown function (DUF5317)